MRIPLDYYRILGLPIQATAEQLQQAHRDRAMQLPRREYSEAAIAARKQLLDEAYSVLSDPEQRRRYDATFLNRSSESATAGESILGTGADPYASSIEIQESQIVGALLVLLELGEYELVLKLGRPYLTGSAALPMGQPGQFDVARSDVLLTLALAYLELGREQWQQGQYESAASSLESGQNLLLREGMFASVRSEMQSDLFKLRPYRILELLSLSTSNEQERKQGLTLLQEMLQERGGIDGNGNDQSGLSVDDFLRFIQQLRGYLTTAEQQALFEAEARRPSAVATYLAIYALLARGFAYRQPALVRRAKHLLLRLGTRQDVHLEQAVCALLLGQTEEANRALEISQEQQSIAFIREQSKGSPDLLPGLCLYSERWLQDEVFPHFRDLAHQKASLKDYFADGQVQAYLEELPNEPETASFRGTSPSSRFQPQESPFGRSPSFGEPVSAYTTSRTAGTATMESDGAENGAGTVPTAERVAQLSPEGRLSGGGNGRRSQPGDLGMAGLSGDRSSTHRNPPPAPSSRIPTTMRSSSGGRAGAPRLDRILFLIALGMLGLSIVWLLGNWITRSLFGGPTLRGEQLEISLMEPPLVIPAPEPTPEETVDPDAPITAETGQEVIEQWLAAKAAANGSARNLNQLQAVLTGTILSERLEAAQALQQAGEVRTYRHEVMDVEVAPPNPQLPDQSQVEATVMEAVDGGSGERLRIRYEMVREDGNWLIRDIVVLGAAEPEPVGSGPQTGAPTAPDASDVSPAPEAPAANEPPEANTVEPTEDEVLIPETTAPEDIESTDDGEG